ncbi:hypothetical protein [Borrelia persica]|uniref:hypothetical protein n=1 Tax=Borrelia persica TaxID=44448 RepID=UPI0004B4D3E3|nr:hypothetical protein [Borrelia persica]
MIIEFYLFIVCVFDRYISFVYFDFFLDLELIRERIRRQEKMQETKAKEAKIGGGVEEMRGH